MKDKVTSMFSKLFFCGTVDVDKDLPVHIFPRANVNFSYLSKLMSCFVVNCLGALVPKDIYLYTYI